MKAASIPLSLTVGDQDANLYNVPWVPKSPLHSKQDLDLFSRFCTAQAHIRTQTDRQADRHTMLENHWSQ